MGGSIGWLVGWWVGCCITGEAKGEGSHAPKRTPRASAGGCCSRSAPRPVLFCFVKIIYDEKKDKGASTTIDRSSARRKSRARPFLSPFSPHLDVPE